MLVSIEALLKILNKQVAMTQGGPGWPVIRVDVCQLEIVLDCVMVLTVCCTILCELVQITDIHHIVTGLPTWLTSIPSSILPTRRSRISILIEASPCPTDPHRVLVLLLLSHHRPRYPSPQHVLLT